MDFPPLVREEVEDSKDKNISVKKENISKREVPMWKWVKV